jgi:DtxR family Mn-dependent transcriptional regulator
VEDALRAIVELSWDQPVRTALLARRLRATPQHVLATLERLASHGLVDRAEGECASLTRHGAAYARRVVRRHRLIELFLVQVLGLERGEVLVEADALEHAVSDRVLERIDTLLGRPRCDLRGEIIPRVGAEPPECPGNSSIPRSRTGRASHAVHGQLVSAK